MTGQGALELVCAGCLAGVPEGKDAIPLGCSGGEVELVGSRTRPFSPVSWDLIGDTRQLQG